MDNHQGPISWVKKLLKKQENSDKKAGKYQYLLIILCIGATLLLVGNIFIKNNIKSSIPEIASEETESGVVNKKNSSYITMAEYEEKYEKELKKALGAMLGVSDDEVTVVVNIDSTEKKVFEKNKVEKSHTIEETDTNGGQRKVKETSRDEKLVIIQDGEKEVPIVVETKKPEIRGVIVVAKGAENIEVKKWIKDAVTRALGVPTHRVGVYPKN
jgi:stage III sporulation protein AG